MDADFLHQIKLLAKYSTLVTGAFHPILKQAKINVAFRIEYTDVNTSDPITVQIQVTPENSW